MCDDENNLTMEQFEINVSRFIEEVQKRRAIWDSNCLQYNNREEKSKCWGELVELFGDFGDCDDDDAATAARKKETEFILQKKWKNIRTCFSRDLRLQRQKPCKKLKNRNYSYKYFTKLKFLAGVTRARCTVPVSIEDTDSDADGSEDMSNREKRDSTSTAEQNIEVEFEEMDDQLSSEEYLSNYKTTQEKPSKKPKLVQLKVEPEPEPEAETNFVDVVDMNSIERRQLPNDDNDGDKLFLLSLLSTMKLVPPEKKMTTRIKIMTVLNEATQATFRYGEASSNTYHN